MHAGRRLDVLSGHLCAASAASPSEGGGSGLRRLPRIVARDFYNQQSDGILSSLSPSTGGLLISLDRPPKLNALTLPMLKRIHSLMHCAEFDEAVRFVVLAGEGKGFCSGGDIMTLAECQMECEASEAVGRPYLEKYERSLNCASYPRVFFGTEYNLDRYIRQFTKPVVALIQGVVMGGGVGLAKNASFTVSTESTLFAMPEAGIGLWPDVSATFFLPRLKGLLGLYLGLCSVRVKGEEVLAYGISTHHVSSPAGLSELRDALMSNPDLAAPQEQVEGRIRDLLASITAAVPAQQVAKLDALLLLVEKYFRQESLATVFRALEANRASDPFARTCLETMRSKCPTSLALFWRTFHLGRTLDISSCMRLEYRAAIRMVRRPDFTEGTLTTLKKKEGAPVYQPLRVEDVPASLVDELLSPLPDGDILFWN